MKRVVATLAVLTFLCACSGSKKEPETLAKNGTWTTQKLLVASKDAALSSMETSERGKAKALAEQGVEFAERCLMRAPENAGCHYWRAVNTGLYYKIRVIGYQKGIKQMVEDCKAVISVNPDYDHAGAYRMLGQIYTKLPQTGGNVDSTTRDLSLAEGYLEKAISLAPDYPENYLALSEVLFAQNKYVEALDSLATAKELTPHWKTDTSYNDWKVTMRGLENKLKKNDD
ncbi:MAG: tetratricopeptide repeat protein [Deltaproteobacteria bacterium]|jgi:tetratricopeptide (TPR) repeat protein|nr:tetratricopeptide repeat protein [Deltaproteobacteria bacterium]